MSKDRRNALSSIVYDSSSSEEESTCGIRQKSSRKMVKPSYFGMVSDGRESCFSSNSSHTDPFASDDSLDVYEPSPKRHKKVDKVSSQANCVYRIKQNAHKSPTVQGTIATNCDYNFDSQFDMLNGNKLAVASSTSFENSDAADMACHSGSWQKENATMEINSQSKVEHTDSNESETMDGTDALDYLQNMNMKLNEIISRIVAMENTMHAITGNSCAKDDKSVHLKRVRDELCAEAELFMKSNALPTQNVDELNRFETNLKDPVFYTAAVSISHFLFQK